MMERSTDFDGWTLNDAVFRCVDAEALRRYQDGQRALRKPRPPRRYLGSRFQELAYIEDLQHAAEVERLYHENASNHFALIDLLHGLLKQGRLVAWGKREEAISQRFFIPTSEWENLKMVHMMESIAEEPKKPETRIVDIRVFPVLRSPNASELISGKSLVEIFRDFVLHDPEVEARGTEALWVHPEYASVFVEGNSELGGTDEWPVTWDEGRIRQQQASSRGDNCKDPVEVAAAVEPLADRFLAMVSLFRSGLVKAWGVPSLSNMRDEVPRPLWSQSEFHFKGSTGEFFEKGPDQGQATKRCWAGLMIVKGDREAQTEGGKTVLSARAKRSRAVFAAIREAGIDLGNKDLGNTSVANMIAGDLKPPIRTAEGIATLAKLVGRLRKGLGAN